MATPLKLDRNLHPTAIVAAFLSNPGRDITLAELRALLPEVTSLSSKLSRMVHRGHLERVSDELYRVGCVPNPKFSKRAALKTAPQRELSLNLGLHPNPIIAAFLSNPGAALRSPGLKRLLPHVPRVYDRVARLVYSGHLRITPNGSTWSEYHLESVPSAVHTARSLSAVPVRVAPTRAPQPQPVRPKTVSEKRVRLALTQAQKDALDAEKKAKRAEDARARTAQIVREDTSTIRAALELHPDGLSEGRLREITGLNRGRLQQTLRALRDQGALRITRQHVADVYQLVRVDLPVVFVTLTPAAEQIAEHLGTRPGDTVPYMAQVLRMPRWEVEGALGALRHLGRLEWTAVEHLAVFRLARPQQEVRNAAD